MHSVKLGVIVTITFLICSQCKVAELLILSPLYLSVFRKCELEK